jgi:predicted transcriptional regulator of viral defense system
MLRDRSGSIAYEEFEANVGVPPAILRLCLETLEEVGWIRRVEEGYALKACCDAERAVDPDAR